MLTPQKPSRLPAKGHNSTPTQKIYSPLKTPLKTPSTPSRISGNWQHPIISDIVENTQNSWNNSDRDRLIFNTIIAISVGFAYNFGYQNISFLSNSTNNFLQNALFAIYGIIFSISIINIISVALKFSPKPEIKLTIDKKETPQFRNHLFSPPMPKPSPKASPLRYDASPHQKRTISSPSNRRVYGSESIRSLTALDKMLKNSELEEPRKVVSETETKSTFLSTSLIQKYQPALKPTESPVIVERLEDGFIVKTPEATLNEWKVESNMNQWTELTRKWLVSKIILPLCKRIDAVDESFKKAEISYLDCSSATFSSVGLQAAASKPQSLMELGQKFPNEPFVIERFKLENHLTVSDYHCRSYIIARIKALSNGYCLAQYRWNSGQNWEGRSWNHEEFPTDAQIVMTLFIHFFDEIMSDFDNKKSQTNGSFSNQYFLALGLKPGIMSKRIQIRQGSKWPPHYQLIVDKVLYDIYPGRNNVFHLLSLFSYCINVKAGGYIGMIDIGGRAVDLNAIIAD